MIQFLDLKNINRRYESEFAQTFQDFLQSGYYIQGKSCQMFEKSFAQYCQTKYAVGTGNGLDALFLILEAYKILGKLKSGDEIIVPANTYIATILAITRAGMIPVFSEPNPATFNLNPKTVCTQITAKTKAVMAVHLYGQITDFQELINVCNENQLILIEDAAQAHGASYQGQKAGSLGDVGAFSFYPTKNLGALGDGGAITTDNQELANLISKLKNYGQTEKYVSQYQGINSRLDEIQAGFLNIKLSYLDEINQKRRETAKQYLTQINNPEIILPFVPDFDAHVFHQFVIRVKNRAHFRQYLLDNGIETLVHYPVAPHQQAAYPEFHPLSLPVTEQLHREVVSLPIREDLTQTEINTIIEKINTY